MHSDHALSTSINGCIGAITSAIMYFRGIRTKKFYDYFFSKDNIASTMERFFTGWPLPKKPSFRMYTSREAKWCRSCKECFDFVLSYLDILLDEHQFRHSSSHIASGFPYWVRFDMPSLDIPYAGV